MDISITAKLQIRENSSWNTPEIAVISVRQNNQYGHPAQQVLDLLMMMNTAIYSTDTDGTITLTSDGEEITVETHDGI